MKRFYFSLLLIFSFSFTALGQSKAPTSVEVSLHNGQFIRLDWSPVSGISEYRIYRNGVLLSSIANPADTSFIDYSPTAGAVLKYCVTTVDMSSNESQFRNCVIDSTYRHSMFASDSVSDAFINVSWSVEAKCLRSSSGNDVYLEIWNESNNEEFYSETLKYEDIPDDTITVSNLYLRGDDYLLLDPSYVAPSSSGLLQRLGYSVSIEGTRMIVGATKAGSNKGAAYIYDKVGSNWVLQATLTASDGQTGDRFGFDVDVFNDYAIVSARTDTGKAYIFEKVGSNWIERNIVMSNYPDTVDDFGQAVSIDNDQAYVAAPGKYFNLGVVYIFKRFGTNWMQYNMLASSALQFGQRFGSDLDVTGNYIVLGAPFENSGKGAAYMMRRSGGGWIHEMRISPAGLAAGDHFGFGVAIHNERAVVGAPGASGNTGNINFYERISNSWQNKGQFTPATVGAGDEFGRYLSILDSQAVVGVPLGNGNIGEAYVYEDDGLGWNFVQRLSEASLTAGDMYGRGVAMAKNEVVIGAPGEDSDRGALYIYDKQVLSWTQVDKIQEGSFSAQTLEMWVKKKGPSNGWGTLFADASTSFNIDGPGDARVNIKINNSSPNYFNYILPDQRWTHLALVADTASGSTKLYVNGELTDELLLYAPIGTERFGAQDSATSTFSINAEVKDLRYWVSSRSAADILTGYDQQLTGTESGLQGYWPADDASGASVAELTGNYSAAALIGADPGSWVVDSIPSLITGSEKDWVGPAETRNYRMRTYEIGFGYELCATRYDTGTTLPFIRPIMSSDSSYPDSILITWINNSDAVSYYKVLRRETGSSTFALMGLLDSTALSFKDVYNPDNSNSLQNGEHYNYCLVPFSIRYGQNLDSVNMPYDTSCIIGTTFPVNLQASDGSYSDRVKLTWNNVQSFGTGIVLQRDGVFLAQLDSTVTSYWDMNPLPGKRYNYELQLWKDSHLVIKTADTGFVPAVGLLAGYVVTDSGHYALPGVPLQLSGIVDGDSITLFDTSGIAGEFRFEQVYFGTGTDFELTAVSPPGYSITNTPRTYSFTSSDHRFERQLILGDKLILPTGTQSITLSTLNVAPMPGMDALRLSWTYTAPDTALFIITRNGALFSILNDSGSGNTNSFIDYSGLPGSTYSYELRMYVHDNDSIVTENSSADSSTFPAVADVGALTATAMPSMGIVRLSWMHSSTNINGFYLYRDGLLIGSVPVDSAFVYDDWYGLPGQTYTYSIEAYVVKEGTEYKSDTTAAAPVLYPALPPALNVVATAVPADDKVLLSWEYPQTANSNFFGFKIVRKDAFASDTIDLVHRDFHFGTSAGNFLYQITDWSGVPATAYTYEVISYKALPFYLAPAGADNESYPVVSKPIPFYASDGAFGGFVNLSWLDTSDNHDGYLILRDLDTLAWLPAHVRVYKDAMASSPTPVTYTYWISAYRKVGNMRYISTPYGNTGNTMPVNNDNLTMPMNFMASDNISNHVELSWDYPPYVLSRFFIYRDGVLMDSVANSIHYYYDTSAVVGTKYVYQIRGNYMGKWSAYAADEGSRVSRMQIQGMASNIEGFGIPNVRINVRVDSRTVAHTQTDSTGYYLISGLPVAAGKLVEVSATKPNARFTDALQSFVKDADSNRYVINFTDTFYQRMIMQEDSVASPLAFTATIDSLTRKVLLHWSVSSGNYTGAKLFRELNEIADIDRSDPKLYLDEYAAPGNRYQYRLKLYWNQSEGTQESQTVSVFVDVPVLSPVVGLRAIPDYDEDIVKLFWGHPTDNHSYYEIKRNGNVIATVKTGSTLYYVDTTGLPLHNYKYEVTCYDIGPAGVFTSEPRMTMAQFPDVAPITDLVLTANPSQNRVEIQWTHTSKYYDYAVVYRNNESIDTVKRAEVPKLSYDYWGIPGDTAEYAVSAVVSKEGNKYESDTSIKKIVFPVILPPTIVSTTLGYDELTVNGAYLPVSGYTGFKLYRSIPGSGDTTFVGSVDERKTLFEITDVDGLPDSAYEYLLRAYKDLNLSYYSAYVSVNASFPKLTRPLNLQATDGSYFNHVLVSWDYPGFGNTGFIIYRDGNPLDTIGSVNMSNPGVAGKGVRHYIDVINDGTSQPDTLYYRVRAYAIKQSKWFESDESNSDSGYAQVQRFESLSSQTGGSAAERLGVHVSMTKSFGISSTSSSNNFARSYTPDAAANFVLNQTPAADPSSGANPAFGYNVDAEGNRVLITAPSAWSNNSADFGYRSGEIYVYDLNGSGTLTLDTILRNRNFVSTDTFKFNRYSNTQNFAVTESNAWSVITAINNVPGTVGPPDNTFGTGANYSSKDGLRFSAPDAFTLNQVTVYPSDTGTFTLTIQETAPPNTIIYTQNFYVEPPSAFDPVVLTLNTVIPGGNYTINGEMVTPPPFGLYRNNSGTSYPYQSTPNFVTINQSTNGTSYYYFFYDWKVSVPTDTVGTRVHEDTTDYARTRVLPWFFVSLPEGTYGSDIQLDSVSVDLFKSSPDGAWIEVFLEKQGGATLSLFKTNNDPVACPQDTVDAVISQVGGTGLLENAPICNTSVNGRYTPISNLYSALNGQPVDGNYRLRYIIHMKDPDNSVANSLSASLTVESVILHFSTLPGGIHANEVTRNARMGYSAAVYERSILGGAPKFNTDGGSVTAYNKSGGSGIWSLSDTILPPATVAAACTYTVHVWYSGWGDYTEWTLKDNTNTTIASGGPYGYGFNQTVSVTTANAPLTFNINTQGFILDNRANFTVTSGGTTLTSGTITPNQNITRTGLAAICSGGQFGFAMDMVEGKAVIGMPRANLNDGYGSRGIARFYGISSDGGWAFKQQLSVPVPQGGDDQFGYSVAMDGPYLAIGAKGDDLDANPGLWDAGSVSIYEFDGGAEKYNLIKKIFNPDGVSKRFEFFGNDVDIAGNYMAVGAPGVDSSASLPNSGAVFLYERDENGNWIFKRRYFAPDGAAQDSFGYSVALAGNTLMVGAPGRDENGSNSGKVYFIYIREQIDSVIASDGTEGNKTRVTWFYTGNRNNLSNFHVYRDGSLIAAADPNKSFIFDYDGIPGKEYVYQVKPVSLDLVEGVAKGDKGWKEKNGILDGSVITELGSVGVPNVNIKAWAFVDGEYFEYNTTTDQNGRYKIKEMYYGDSTRYFVTASFKDHVIVPDTQDIEFNLIQFERSLDPFRDKTAYVAKGIVRYKNSDCPVDSINVKMTEVFADSSRTVTQAKTDENGNFSFNLYPDKKGLLRTEFRVDTMRVMISTSASDTVYFKFDPEIQKITSFTNLPKVSNLLPFEDTITYPVQFFVRNTCGPIGSNRWKIQIQSETACYSKVITTDNNGRKKMRLPARNFVFRVIAVAEPSADNLPVIDYLKVRPRKLELFDIHKKIGKEKKDTSFQVDFIFHITPSIEVTNLSNFLCNEPNRPVVVTQGDNMDHSIEVNEIIQGNKCHVTEGYLIIRNEAARDQNTRIDFDIKAQKFPSYKWTVGQPNIVSPFIRTMVIEYHTESDGFLGQLAVPFIVQGIASIPGTDIIVAPKTDGNQLNLPLMILRDPPGDGSYSYIDSGRSFTTKIDVAADHTFLGGVSLELALGVKLTPTFKLETEFGGGFGDKGGFSLGISTSKRISTSPVSEVDNAENTDWLTGTSADVIVGAGASLQYGIARQIFVDAQCLVHNRKTITTGAEINTTWIYTKDQIDHLIRENKANLELAKQGLFTIQRKNEQGNIETLSQSATEDYLKARIMNWEEILRYYSVTTLPHYALCDPANIADIPEPWKSNLNTWRKEGFCELIGTYTTVNGKETFTLKPDSTWEWNTDLLKKYNSVREVVRTLENDYLDYPGGLTFSEDQLNKVKVDEGYYNLYGADAKNITFSGGTSFSEERAVSRSSSRGYKQFWYNDTKLTVGIAVDDAITGVFGVWGGFGAGAFVGIIQNFFKYKFSLQGYFGYKFNFEKEQVKEFESSQTIGYELSDDDPGDQFSVTIIRGVQPTHTPYFDLFGGRSSCPKEPGTIARDLPVLKWLDPQGNPYDHYVVNKADPDKTVQLQLQLTNNNQFFEGRWYTLYVLENSNPLGATLQVNGRTITTSAREEFFIGPEESFNPSVTFKRNPYFYDYEGIQLAMFPSCDIYIPSKVSLDVHFRHPCSEISIIDPGNNWLLNTDTSKLAITLSDYNPSNTVLKRVQVVQRRLGSVEWDTILSVTPQFLKRYFDSLKTVYPVPTYPFVWDISTTPDLPDGEYEIMAIANCMQEGMIFSNRVKGRINRRVFQVLGTPEPADRLLSLGDEISVAYNKDIDCDLSKSRAMVSFRADSANGAPVSVHYTCYGNKMVFVIDTLWKYEDRMIYAVLDSVVDVNGNRQIAPAVWSFRVSNNPVYWWPASLEVTVEKDRSGSASAWLKNSGAGNEAFVMAMNSSWLGATDMAGMISPSGKVIGFGMNASGLSIGTYYDTVRAHIAGFTVIELPVTMHVIKTRPDWQVDASKYEHSVSVIANPDIDSSGLSMDSNDVVLAYLNGTLRGFANVQKVGTGYYAAYLTVYGNDADVGREIDFRVWDGSRGALFQGHPDNAMPYTAQSTIYGTTPNPEIIRVNTSIDSLRYIPLKKGWNWFSINTQMEDMSVSNVLKSLTPTTGDVLMTHFISAEYLSDSAQYQSGGGWVDFGIDSFRNEEGYLLHLSKADTLIISGRAANNDVMILNPGWNLIGYQPQKARGIDTAWLPGSPIPGWGDQDIIKSQDEFAVYNLDSTRWEGSLSLLRPYEAYKVKVGQTQALYYRGKGPATWYVNPAAYEHTMRVMAIVKIDGYELLDVNSKVAAYSGDKCRGVGQLRFVPEINRYVAELIVYGNGKPDSDEISFYIWDAVVDTVYECAQTLVFKDGKLTGSLSRPFILSPRNATGISTLGADDFGPVFSISPNPFESELRISFADESPQKYHVELYNGIGEIFFRRTLYSSRGENTWTIHPGKKLANGMYYVTIRQGSSIVRTFKVVKD